MRSTKTKGFERAIARLPKRQVMRGKSYCGHCMVNSDHTLQPACMGVKAAFFGDFLCSSKESYPPAGEAATAIKAQTRAAHCMTHLERLTPHTSPMKTQH